MVDIRLKIRKAWLSIANFELQHVTVSKLYAYMQPQSLLLRDYTTRATISSSSLLDNGNCTNLLTNIYKRRSAGKNKGKHVAGDISRNCVSSVLPPGSKRRTHKNTHWQIREACERAFAWLLKYFNVEQTHSYLNGDFIC